MLGVELRSESRRERSPGWRTIYLSLAIVQPRLLKNWTARSCLLACSKVLKVPRFRRRRVLGSVFLEYSR
jgi:hypothetical protein